MKKCMMILLASAVLALACWIGHFPKRPRQA